jgi:hypothetical protein
MMQDKYRIVFRKNVDNSIEENLTVSESDMLAQITILINNGYKILSVRSLEKIAKVEGSENGEARQ